MAASLLYEASRALQNPSQVKCTLLLTEIEEFFSETKSTISLLVQNEAIASTNASSARLAAKSGEESSDLNWNRPQDPSESGPSPVKSTELNSAEAAPSSRTFFTSTTFTVTRTAKPSFNPFLDP
jgi:hypothetical protein